MKFPRLFIIALIATLVGAPLSAQTAPAPAAAPVKAVPTARVAWINTNAFMDEESGIKQLVRVLKELELEFSGTQSELSLLNEKLRTIVGEINRLQAGGEANAAAVQEKQAEGLKLQRELQGKQQQAQQAVAQAQQEKQAPISAQVGKSLEAFAKERDISLLIDVAKLGEGLLVARPEIDLTADFIAYYNAANP
jgi:Skp family chaperone for outer membrane proteins